MHVALLEVFQMICKDTVEDRVLTIQAEKERLAEQGEYLSVLPMGVCSAALTRLSCFLHTTQHSPVSVQIAGLPVTDAKRRSLLFVIWPAYLASTTHR